MATSRRRGFTLVELLVSMAIAALVLASVLTVYVQVNSLKGRVRASVKIQSNVRLAMDRLARDLRLVGFAVPAGIQVGGTAVWTPTIFHASQTEIGYRADVDGGFAEIVCTPDALNTNCLLDKLRLDTIRYYQTLNCVPPDGASGGLRLVASLDRDAWEPLDCSGYATADGSISVSAVTNATFTAGISHVATIEQVYYRYVPGGQPPYGTVVRHVRHDNAPSSSFPPISVTWTTVADHLTDFWIEYRDETGTALTTFPLSAADRAAVRTIVLFMEGYDQVGQEGQPQLVQARSEILVRNRS
jgi:prepilin-type N-terminal cleavage/methylation domain-containing protein